MQQSLNVTHQRHEHEGLKPLSYRHSLARTDAPISILPRLTIGEYIPSSKGHGASNSFLVKCAAHLFVSVAATV